jgi:hypothetical protein
MAQSGIVQEAKGRLEATTGLMSVMAMFHQLTGLDCQREAILFNLGLA